MATATCVVKRDTWPEIVLEDNKIPESVLLTVNHESKLLRCKIQPLYLVWN